MIKPGDMVAPGGIHYALARTVGMGPWDVEMNPSINPVVSRGDACLVIAVVDNDDFREALVLAHGNYGWLIAEDLIPV